MSNNVAMFVQLLSRQGRCGIFRKRVGMGLSHKLVAPLYVQKEVIVGNMSYVGSHNRCKDTKKVSNNMTFLYFVEK